MFSIKINSTRFQFLQDIILRINKNMRQFGVAHEILNSLLPGIFFFFFCGKNRIYGSKYYTKAKLH